MDLEESGCHKKTAQRAAKVPNLPPPDNWIDVIIACSILVVNGRADEFEKLRTN